MRTSKLVAVLVTALCLCLGLGLVGCGDDDGGTENNNNEAVDEHLSDELLMAQGNDPDFTCIGTPDPALSFTTETEISGVVGDYEEDWPVEGVIVAIYESVQDLLDDNPYDVSDETPPSGAYSLMAPAGVPRLHFKSWDPTGQGYFVTMELNEPVAGMPPGPPQATGKDRSIVSAVTIEKIPAILGIQRIEGRGMVGGTVFDCNRHEVENAGVRTFDLPADDPSRTLLSLYDGPNRNSFYIANGMPVRGQMFTDFEGGFVVANLIATPGAAVTMEVWGRLEAGSLPAGFDDCTEGCKLASQQLPVLPDSIVITDMIPMYSE